MRHVIKLDTQYLYQYWAKNVYPYKGDPWDNPDIEAEEYFDAWLRWFMDQPCLFSNDVTTLYERSDITERRIEVFGIEARATLFEDK